MEIPLTRRHHRGKYYWSVSAGVFFLLFTSLPDARGQSTPANTQQTLIPKGTAIKLRLTQTITSTHAHRGDPLSFEVVKDVTVDGLTAIRAGTAAQGSVAKIHGRRLCGVGGQVIVKLDSVELADGERVTLDGRREFKGGSRTRLMAEGMLIAGAIHPPVAAALLLTRGHECTVLKGSEVNASLDGNLLVPSANLARAPESDSSLSGLISLLPPRVLNGRGREGDMMNLLFVAREDDFRRVFADAGWVEADKPKPTAFWHLMWQRKHYARLPMDTFYAFGRCQDFSYSLPDPTGELSRRHHVRIWKTDYEVNGVPVWVGAATHDVGLQFVKHGLWITHRIDPDVDAEREFIAQNLMKTDLVTREEYLPSAVPIFDARTTTGEPFHSDSRVLMLELSQAPTPTFARIQPPARLPRWLHRSAYKESLPVATPFK